MNPLVRHRSYVLSAVPEFDLAIFALLLNFPWEILQAPLFEGMAGAPHSTVISACLRATVGDMVILLTAHAGVALITRRRLWLSKPSGGEVAGFMAIGVGITAAIEWLSARGHWVQSWVYAAAMPVIPVVDLGLSPLLQWVVIPPVAIWFVVRLARVGKPGAGR